MHLVVVGPGVSRGPIVEVLDTSQVYIFAPTRRDGKTSELATVSLGSAKALRFSRGSASFPKISHLLILPGGSARDHLSSPDLHTTSRGVVEVTAEVAAAKDTPIS